MPELNLYTVRTNALGYGRFGLGVGRALRNLGLDVFSDMPMPDAARMPHEDPGDVPAKKCHVVAWLSVPNHARGWWSDQHPTIWTMWESGSLPETFRESLHNFAQVIVPSRQNQELFSRYHDNVSFVPLGIDPVVWHPVKRPAVGATFRFLVAGSGARKGTDLAYKAFRAAFPTVPDGGPTPILVMKNPKSEPFYGPDIEMVGGRISDEAEVDLYATSHCYVGPSRGEGFGLQPLQAMAQGCPTILTAAHGHDAFAHLGLGIPAVTAKAGYFLYGDAGDWWEPDFDALVERMRWVYANYDPACVAAAHSARFISTNYTWEATARGFVDAVGPERFELPSDPAATWFAPDAKFYRTRVTRRWRADIAGSTYQFDPGVDYWERADVKRILMETGVLDPVCLTDEDPGLGPDQAAEIGAYSAHHSFCDSCGQQLGTRPTRADVLEEAMS